MTDNNKPKSAQLTKPHFDQFEACQDAGFTIIPVRGKAPLDDGWQNREYEPRATLARIKRDKLNAGYRIPANVFVFDPDVIDAKGNRGLEAYESLCFDIGFDDSDFHRVRTGSGGKHVYGTIPPGFRTRTKFEGYGGVQTRRKGNQTVLPGSVHPDTGELYRFEDDSPDWSTPLQPFPQCVLDLIAAPEKPEREPVEGGVYTPAQVRDMLDTLDPAKLDYDEWLQVGMAAKHANEDALEAWLDWSERDPRYADKRDENEMKWESFNGEGVTFQTLEWHVRKADGAATLAQLDFADAPPLSDEDLEDGIKATGKYLTKKISQLLALPNPKWLVQGLLIERGLYEIYGRFKTGKTFWAVEIACCVATGHDFFDIRVKRGRVLYVIAEGSRKLFAYRLHQWAKERATDEADFKRLSDLLEANIDVLSVAVPINSTEEVKNFIADNPDARSLVVIDTLFRSMKGDVMNPGDFQKFINGCAYIQRKLDCGVLFLHHQKRNDAKGAFGSVVGEASVDVALKTSAPRKGVSVLRVEILRDGDAAQKPWECKIEERPIDDPTLAEGDVSTIGVLVFESRGTADILRAMVQAIEDHEPETVDDLARVMGLSKTTAERRLRKCREKEWVASGNLMLTKEGKAQVSYDFEDFEEEE